MKVLIDTTTYKHNTAAMHKIERESQLDADAAGHQANISDGSKNAYYTGYHVRLVRIVRSYTEKIEKAVDYENGLFKWLYLDGNGQIVAETIGDAPLFELDDIKAAAVLGAKGGSVKSERKAAASSANGKKGGRPRKTGQNQPKAIE